MALAKYVALELAVGCEELGINDLEYFKLQKLVYICQCVHFKRFGVPLFPEKLYKSSSGAYLKELYLFFVKYEDSFIFKDDSLDKIKQWCNNVTDTLIFERETIIFVLKNYGNKSVNELIKLTKKDPLFNNIKYGEIVNIAKLNEYFISNEHVSNIISGKGNKLINKNEKVKKLKNN